MEQAISLMSAIDSGVFDREILIFVLIMGILISIGAMVQRDKL